MALVRNDSKHSLILQPFLDFQQSDKISYTANRSLILWGYFDLFIKQLNFDYI